MWDCNHFYVLGLLYFSQRIFTNKGLFNNFNLTTKTIKVIIVRIEEIL